MGGTDYERLHARLGVEILREPRFPQYNAPAELDLAIEATLERIEEWDHAADPHGWCHERPLLIALVLAALNWQQDAPVDGTDRG